MSVKVISNSIMEYMKHSNNFFCRDIFSQFQCNTNHCIKALTSIILIDADIIEEIKKIKYDYIIINLGIVECYTRYLINNYLTPPNDVIFKKNREDITINDWYQHQNIDTFKSNFIYFIENVPSNIKIFIHLILLPIESECIFYTDKSNNISFNYYKILKKQIDSFNAFLISLNKYKNIYICDFYSEINNNPKYEYATFIRDTSTHIVNAKFIEYNKIYKNIINNFDLNDKRIRLDNDDEISD